MPHSNDDAKQATKRAYDRVADAYDEGTEHFQQKVVYPALIKLLSENLGALKGRHVLDVGCGSGRLLTLLTAEGVVCRGIDISTTFVNRACAHGLSVVEGSMDALPFEDGVYDAVVSNFALNYLPLEGQQRALSEQYRVLKKDGVLVFSCMHPFLMRVGHTKYFSPTRVQTVEQLGEQFTLHLTDWCELQDMSYHVGFENVRFVDVGVPKELPEIVSAAKDESLRAFAAGFNHMPYALFVIARS